MTGSSPPSMSSASASSASWRENPGCAVLSRLPVAQIRPHHRWPDTARRPPSCAASHPAMPPRSRAPFPGRATAPRGRPPAVPGAALAATPPSRNAVPPLSMQPSTPPRRLPAASSATAFAACAAFNVADSVKCRASRAACSPARSPRRASMASPTWPCRRTRRVVGQLAEQRLLHQRVGEAVAPGLRRLLDHARGERLLDQPQQRVVVVRRSRACSVS